MFLDDSQHDTNCNAIFFDLVVAEVEQEKAEEIPGVAEGVAEGAAEGGEGGEGEEGVTGRIEGEEEASAVDLVALKLKLSNQNIISSLNTKLKSLSQILCQKSKSYLLLKKKKEKLRIRTNWLEGQVLVLSA